MRQPHNLAVVNGLLDYALTRDQTLRVGYSQNIQSFGNIGVGGFDLPERAFFLKGTIDQVVKDASSPGDDSSDEKSEDKSDESGESGDSGDE